jgi:hypothetical protein
MPPSSMGSIIITGVIPAVTQLVVTPVPGLLDLTVTTNDQTVATVKEMTNTSNGYVVTMSSVNQGLLKNGTIGAVPYSAKYQGVPVIFGPGSITLTDTSGTSSVTNVTKPLSISFSGTSPENLMAGPYSDTLTFTISTK